MVWGCDLNYKILNLKKRQATPGLTQLFFESEKMNIKNHYTVCTRWRQIYILIEHAENGRNNLNKQMKKNWLILNNALKNRAIATITPSPRVSV